jgi:hypothetical protein
MIYKNLESSDWFGGVVPFAGFQFSHGLVGEEGTVKEVKV